MGTSWRDPVVRSYRRIPLAAEEIYIELFSAVHVRQVGREGRGHVGSTVEGGCLNAEWSRTVRLVGVRMAAMAYKRNYRAREDSTVIDVVREEIGPEEAGGTLR